MKKNLLFILLLSFIFFDAKGQTRQITGKVTEKGSNEEVPSASILVKGTTVGTQADVKGLFKLTVPDKPGVILLIRSIGYKNIEIALQPGQSTVTAVLETNSKELNEVVAIGYATVKRRDIAGSVTSVTDKDLKDVPTNSLAEALEGRMAGVQVTVSQGAPGADADINIRGRNSITQSGSPLFIVDGVQVDNALNVISPQDIASIDVLKDAASTAIYGSRGSNGVIIITTKGGKNTNGKITVNYNGFMAIQKLAKELPVMNAHDFIAFEYDRYKLTNDSSIITRYTRLTSNFDTIQTYAGQNGIDWQQKMFGRNALMQTHNFSISGGTDKYTFNLSVTDNAQQGILLGSDYNRQIVNFKFDQQANTKLRVGFNVRYNKQTINGAGTSDVGGAGSNNLRQIVRYPPFLTAGADDNAYDPTLANLTNGNGMRLVNPIDILPATYRQNNNNVIDINANINYMIAPNLSFRSVGGYDVYNTQIKAYNDTLNSDAQTNLNLPTAQLTNGQVITVNNSNVLDYTNRSFLHTKGSVDLLAGVELYQTDTRAAFQNVRYFPVGLTPDEAFANFSLAAPPAGFQQPAATSSEVMVHTFSYFSRLNYTYNDKYIFNFTIRADGSSIFGPEKKWGYFPSGSFAWRVSQEKFMQNQDIFSDLKLRLSYGTAGNNRITPYSYDPSYAPGKPYYLNGAPILGLAPSTVLANPDLQWETLVSRNLGLDMSFLKGRIQLTVDAYFNITNNLLINNVVPVVSGYSTQFQNVGSTQNKGLEFTLSAVVMQQKDFRWNANFNIAFNKNTIRSLGSQSQFYANSGWFGGIQPADFLVKVGDEVGTMYGLVNDGHYSVSDFTATPYSNAAYPWATTQYTLKPGVPTSGITSSTIQPGTQKFKDISGPNGVPDGVVNGSDFTVIGHALPKFTGGLSQTFTYKNFDMSLFLNFSYGGQVYNDNKLEFTSAYSNGANLLSIMNDRWRVSDPNTGQYLTRLVGNPQIVIGQSPDVINAVNGNAKYWIPVTGVEYDNPQSFAVEDGSFLRINNLTIGYTFPKVLLGKLSLSNFRIYATGNNLGTITGYSGYDPEVSTRRGSPLTPNVDYSAYPRARTYLMGVNVSF